MSNLIIVPKKNGYLVRNQNDNKEMAVFKTKQDAQAFVRNYKSGKLNAHNHGHNNQHICAGHNNGGLVSMYPQQQFPSPVYQNMQGMPYSPIPGQMYPNPNMMYPQQQFPSPVYQNMQGMPYSPIPGQMYPNPNMMYPQQVPVQPYNSNMMMGYGATNNSVHSSMNQQCECGYIYNNEYEEEIDEDNFLDFETDSPELIKPPEISETNESFEEQKTEVEKSKINIPNEHIPVEENIINQQPAEEVRSFEEVQPVEKEQPFVESVVIKEPTIAMTDLTNFSIEKDYDVDKVDDQQISTQEQVDPANLSKKELKKLKKQQKKELKLIKKQEKKNNHIYDEMEEYDF